MRWYGRLARAREIAHVRRRGRVLRAETLQLYAVPARTGESTRVCISASKALGGAVIRNRARRRVRGALDALTLRPSAHRLLFVLDARAATAAYDRLAHDVAFVLGRLPSIT